MRKRLKHKRAAMSDGFYRGWQMARAIALVVRNKDVRKMWKAKIAKALAWWQRRRVAAAYRGWVVRVEEWVAQKRRIAKAVRRWQNQTKHDFILRWTDFACQRKIYVAMRARARLHFAHWLLGRALRAWQAVASHERVVKWTAAARVLQRAWKGRKARKFVNDLRALARYTWERKVNGELDVLQLTLRNFDVHVQNKIRTPRPHLGCQVGLHFPGIY